MQAARLLYPTAFHSKGAQTKNFPLLYLTALSVLDASICLGYVLIMGMDALGLYMRWEWLYLAWTYYGIPVFAVSRIVQLASSWLIVAATFERHVVLQKERGRLVSPLPLPPSLQQQGKGAGALGAGAGGDAGRPQVPPHLHRPPRHRPPQLHLLGAQDRPLPQLPCLHGPVPPLSYRPTMKPQRAD